MSEMSWVEIYFYVGVVWSFVEVGVALKDLVTKMASKSLNSIARAERQAEIDRFYTVTGEGDYHVSIKVVAVTVGFVISSAITTIFWPASVFMFVRNRT